MSLREYTALWDAKLLQEKRRDAVGGVLVEQMGHLIAMVANAGNLKWDAWRQAEEFMPKGWSRRHSAEPEPPEEDMDTKLRRLMPRLKAYQDGQVAAGIR